MNISPNDLKWELGLGAVKEIANVRKALGQKDWQQTNVNESDAQEVRKYYELIRQKMRSPQEALLTIAESCTGTEAKAQNDMIDENAIDHSEHRDGQEETSELVVAIRGATQEAALAMTDVGKAAAASVVDAFFIFLGSNVVSELTERSANTRSNFGEVVASVKNAPLDLRDGSLPGKKNQLAKTDNWSLGLIDSCLELAEAYSDRLVLEEKLRQAHKEKLFTALVIYASLHSRPPSPKSSTSTNSSTSTSEVSTQEERAMIQWLFSIFKAPTNPYPISLASVFMTGVC